VVTRSLRLVHDLRVPMRDGVELALDLIRPDVPGPLPVVLVRTPYDKTAHRLDFAARYEEFARRGYVVAVNDCRGRYNSDGEFFPYMNEHDDGYDVIEWIAAQEWCDGNVGMIGGSYDGQVQWQAASRTPPHLKAIVPIVSPPSTLWRNEPVFNGVFMLSFAEWMTFMGRRTAQTPAATLLTEPQDYLTALPVSELPAAAGVTSSWWHEFTAHPTYDEFWARGGYGDYEQIDVPALNITGWWDLNFPGAPENFTAMRARGATADARRGQRLVIGPWPHGVNRSRTLSGVDFGPDAVIDLDTYVLRFFDRWLRGVRNGVDDEPPVHVFIVGADEWRSFDTFPVPGTEYRPFYLHSGGSANTLLGDGALSEQEPLADEPDDSYLFDPTDVFTQNWSVVEGPVDDRVASTRPDVLCYTSEPLTAPLDVAGWVTAVLWASSSARDTDWHVRLVDVHPDGTARFLCRGALRARFRDSWAEPELLEPGRPTRFEFTMDATGVRFLPGHRIRVEVTSSWYTQYDLNMNTGAENPFTDDSPTTAVQHVLHRPGAASHVLLPVLPEDAGS
jgi:putative CocE/NonD family hydrolase